MVENIAIEILRCSFPKSKLTYGKQSPIFYTYWLSCVRIFGLVEHPASGREWYTVHLAGWTRVISMFVYRSQSTLLAR